MKTVFTKGFALGVALLAGSCINNPTALKNKETGVVEIWASVTKPQTQNVLGKLGKVQETTWDSIVVTVSASDIDTLRTVSKFNAVDAYTSLSLDNIPAGKKRTISVSTKSKANEIIHTCNPQIIEIVSSEKKVLDFKLVPIKGSIYVEIGNIPTNVKRVFSKFAGITSTVERSPKLFLSLDNIPDKSKDSLVIEGLDTTGSVLYRSATWLVFSVLRDTSVKSSFGEISTGLTANISAQMPGVTVVSTNVTNDKSNVYESGKLIVTEIMYNANDSEYIEIYNPTPNRYSDSLLLEIDGTNRSLGLVSIPSKGYYVVGRKSLPWTDAFLSIASALDLSSNGNWISLRCRAVSDTVLDRVAFTGGSNSLQWPNLGTAKKSIILDSLSLDPLNNNYGKNWIAAEKPITQLYPSAITNQFGSPKNPQ